MGLFESLHPVSQDMEQIQSALMFGLAERNHRLPDNIALNYEDAFASGVGISTLRIANWATKNQSVVYFPLAVPKDDPKWHVECEDGFQPINQRVLVQDMLGRGFRLRHRDIEDLSPYLQFDIIDEGIVFSARPGEHTVSTFGGFESETYDALSSSVRITTGIAELVTISANM